MDQFGFQHPQIKIFEYSDLTFADPDFADFLVFKETICHDSATNIKWYFFKCFDEFNSFYLKLISGEEAQLPLF